MMQAVALRIWRWLANLFRFRAPYRSLRLEGDLPVRLRRKTLYIVEEDGYLEHVAMVCPCGCGQILYMNLIPDERPCWKLIEHKNRTVSLHPSVWRQKGCRSHFWFRHGLVVWVD